MTYSPSTEREHLQFSHDHMMRDDGCDPMSKEIVEQLIKISPAVLESQVAAKRLIGNHVGLSCPASEQIAYDTGTGNMANHMEYQEACSESEKNEQILSADISNRAIVQGSVEVQSRKGSFKSNFQTPPIEPSGFGFAKFRLIEAFPRHIALAMLKGDKIRPVSKPMVSLFFSDIVGFTSFSSTMPPFKVSDLLDRLYTKFDRLAYLHGVQKIDVIGDSYIAATNLAEHQPADHAARLARFALSAMQAAWDTAVDDADPDGSGAVQLRIGLHCGAVTGCILGTQCYKYTVLGDAVNTASRMESCGLPGRIHCSAEAAELIGQQAHDMTLLPRRETPRPPRPAARRPRPPAPTGRPPWPADGQERMQSHMEDRAWWNRAFRAAGAGAAPDRPL